ncbi:hypothetical protein PACTADRAFT_51162 [Pachysolen tannophilus NRRL Y-2460]|uniref:Uncharacterized protein n=1 Tax=Pachysolen tannophilus NRRL Y-2460 TaxID=669874 RepID=A0A1E4TRD3_PACTA|nr:hypothetical protein PACTADRAFT_51162 [Pachysolen tannophilus NRRL Y-2460]
MADKVSESGINSSTLEKVKSTEQKLVSDSKDIDSSIDGSIMEGPDKSVESIGKTKDELLQDILLKKSMIDFLINDIQKTKRLSEKLEVENKYLQDYSGSLMASNGMTDKK